MHRADRIERQTERKTERMQRMRRAQAGAIGGLTEREREERRDRGRRTILPEDLREAPKIHQGPIPTPAAIFQPI